MSPAAQKFIAASEAARHLGVSLNTVKRRVDAGLLAGFKDPDNGRYTVNASAVARALLTRARLERKAAIAPARPRREGTKARTTRRRTP